MDITTQIQNLNQAILIPAVCKLLGSASVELEGWQVTALHYETKIPSSGGLYRVNGQARARDSKQVWSLILKVVQAPLRGSWWYTDDPADFRYWKREPLVYASGLLDDLPGARHESTISAGGLVAPGCFGIVEQHDGVVWLWLEDVAGSEEAVQGSWSLERYRLAARHLGRFNGAYLAGCPLPDAPWLSRNDLRVWTAAEPATLPEVSDFLSRESTWACPSVQRICPAPEADALLRVWAQWSKMLDILDCLPQTFTHHDAHRNNLFARRQASGQEQTVAIDWALAGIGAIGEEIAGLVVGTLSTFQVAAKDAGQLDKIAWHGYLQGLREAGWNGEPYSARLGYAIKAVAVGALLARALQTALAACQSPPAEQFGGWSLDEFIEQTVGILAFLNRLAKEVWH